MVYEYADPSCPKNHMSYHRTGLEAKAQTIGEVEDVHELQDAALTILPPTDLNLGVWSAVACGHSSQQPLHLMKKRPGIHVPHSCNALTTTYADLRSTAIAARFCLVGFGQSLLGTAGGYDCE